MDNKRQSTSGDANEDKSRQNRRHRRQTSQTSGDAIHHLWMTRKEALGYLKVSPRTLERMVTRGEVARQRIGRQSRYRIINWRQQAKSETTNKRQASINVTSMTPVSDVNDVSFSDASSNEEATLDLSKLIGLVDRLEREKTDAIVRGQELCKERDEAIRVGHQLADQRDQIARESDRRMGLLRLAHEALTRSNSDVKHLHEAIDSLTDAIATVCSSALAVPVRRRLRAVLATC